MRTPGFTAELSLYRSTAYYWTLGSAAWHARNPEKASPSSQTSFAGHAQTHSRGSEDGVRGSRLVPAARPSWPINGTGGIGTSGCHCEHYGANGECTRYLCGPGANSPCLVGWTYVNGMCRCEGELCNGSCAHTNTDPNNCGACGTACPIGGTCSDGNCTGGTGCPAGSPMVCPTGTGGYTCCDSAYPCCTLGKCSRSVCADGCSPGDPCILPGGQTGMKCGESQQCVSPVCPLDCWQ